MRREKVLIIKLGYSETLINEAGIVSSLGDVLRTTPVLYAFKDSDVTWLVDEKARELLAGNPFIKRVMVFDLMATFQLQKEKFDVVVNFEKIPGICVLADSISAKSRYGFGFDEEDGSVKAYDMGEGAQRICGDRNHKKAHSKYWQEFLFEMVGRRWDGEGYILGYKPKTREAYDIGLNYAVGGKWPNKAWPRHKWEGLSKLLLDNGYNFSWQRGFNDMREYIDWINSCRLLVTSDSLGLHIALALGKKLVVLYGPTPSSEIYLYGLGSEVHPKADYDCIPCLLPHCRQERICMEFIDPYDVFKEAVGLMGDISLKATPKISR